jgi:hypothetical protein
MSVIKRSVSFIFPLATIIFVSSLEKANATTVTVNAVNSGWYNYYGVPNGTTANIAIWGDNYRDWLGFNLSGVNGVITSAILQVNSDSRNSSGQTINWWDVTSPYASLGTASGAAGLSIFKDLDSGTLFGTGIHTAGTLNSFTLNAAALQSLNNSHSFWAIGGQESSQTYAFGYRNGLSVGETFRLVLDVEPQSAVCSSTVPEAGSSLALLGFGVGGLIMFGMVAAKRNRAESAA